MKKRFEPFLSPLGKRSRKKESFGKEKTTFVKKKEIALFFIIVLVFSIVGFSEGVGAQTTRPVIPDAEFSKFGYKIDMNGQCVIGMCDIDSKEGCGSIEDFTRFNTKLDSGEYTKVLSAAKKGIVDKCGDGAGEFFDKISKTPDKFGGKVTFPEKVKGGLPTFDKFRVGNEVKEFDIKGFGKLKNGGIINTNREGHNLILKEKQTFELDDSFSGIKQKIGKLGQNSNNRVWVIKKLDTDGMSIKGGGLMNIKGAEGWENNPLNFKNFEATLDENGNYVGDFRAELDGTMFKDPKKTFQTINLNGEKYVDLTKSADFTGNFDDHGVIKSINVKAKDAQVDGFGFLDKDSGININGISIEKGNTAIIQAGSPSSGSKAINDYRLYGDGSGRVFYQYDDKVKNIQYIVPNDEKNALHMFKDKKLMSNKIEQNFLIDNKEVTFKPSKFIPRIGPVSPENKLANDYIELISSTNDINTKVGNPAIKLFQNQDGSFGVVTKGVQNADVFGPDGKIIYKLNGGKLNTARKSTFLLDIQNLDELGIKRGFKPDLNGNWQDLDKKLTKQGGKLGDVATKVPGGAKGNTENNGLTWLIVIGGVGAIAAYAFSQSGKDKNKDKNRDNSNKNQGNTQKTTGSYYG